MRARDVGLSEREYDAIVRELGREPNDLELRLFGVMWSEHCSYKSTRPLLKLFPTEGKAVFQGPGENAGVVKLSEEWGLAFKVESHNHPSAVEPYQGAATGVGGIIRDILAMGARPVASMDGLFFGEEDHPRTRHLAPGIVHGVGGYGNAVGVPTVGGKTTYDPCYTENPLVNAFCAGVVRLDRIAKSSTACPGSLVLLLGAKTGRDGIAGAAFASVELAEERAASRPQVQIGDPFTEKLLIECCLELLEEGLVEAMQDMGAAGIVSSSSEIAAKSGVGMRIALDRVPLREADMAPWEITLSESQERMLLVVTPEKHDAVRRIAKKWGLDCAHFGDVTEGTRYVLTWHGEEVADLPPDALGGNAPVIPWDALPPTDLETRGHLDVEELPLPEDWGKALLSLLADPNLRGKCWIYEQYDSMVQTNTAVGPGFPVSLLRVRETGALFALAMEADPWKCFTDPGRGGAEVVARSVRALAVCGARPLGFTNCLNFPSPEKPDQFFELRECVRGMADAARALECPVVSGNVSLYNESPRGRILPTPLVVTVGVVDAAEGFLPAGAIRDGDLLFLAGMPNASLGASRWQLSRFGTAKGKTIPFNADAERDFAERARETAKTKAARSGRPLAGGGLAAAIAKECVASDMGAEISFLVPTRADVLLFGEGGPRALYAVAPESAAEFRRIWSGFPLAEIGIAGGDSLDLRTSGCSMRVSLPDLRAALEG